MKRALVTAVAAAVMLVPTAFVGPANAMAIGHEGCTPGYWKTHTDNWEETSPSTLFGTLFTSAPSNVATLTMEEALAGGGGSGVDGASLILARAAAASWLNSAHEGLGFPWRRFSNGLDGRPPLVSTVNAAFASGDRDTMLALAAQLDADNNLGCPLS